MEQDCAWHATFPLREENDAELFLRPCTSLSSICRFAENLSVALANKPLNKSSAVKLRKTLEPFIQDSSCGDIAPKLMKCRECKMTTLQRNKKMPNIFCRFYAFRRYVRLLYKWQEMCGKMTTAVSFLFIALRLASLFIANNSQ